MERYTKRIPIGLAATALAVLAGAGMGGPDSSERPSPRELFEAARDRFARIDSYIARLTRHEVVKGERRPDEVILLKARERPWSVYMKWLGQEGRGREGVYVRGRYGDKIHTRLAAGDIPFVPAGRRMALSPNGALMRSASTHPITELGVGAAIDKIGGVLEAQERGDRSKGGLSVVGPEQRAEFGAPVYGLEHRLPAGTDPALPRGGRRTYYIDPVTSLPELIVTTDDTGREAEYYRYDRIQPGVRLDEDDFNPDLLWPAPRRANAAGSADEYRGPDRP